MHDEMHGRSRRCTARCTGRSGRRSGRRSEEIVTCSDETRARSDAASAVATAPSPPPLPPPPSASALAVDLVADAEAPPPLSMRSFSRSASSVAMYLCRRKHQQQVRSQPEARQEPSEASQEPASQNQPEASQQPPEASQQPASSQPAANQPADRRSSNLPSRAVVLAHRLCLYRARGLTLLRRLGDARPRRHRFEFVREGSDAAGGGLLLPFRVARALLQRARLLEKLRRLLAERLPEGIRRSRKESEGVGRSRKESEGVGRSRKESEGFRRSRKGVGRSQKKCDASSPGMRAPAAAP